MPSKKDPFNSDHIDFLLTIADTGAIGKSGEKFNLSPSAATRLLDRYRYFFGDPLFVVSKGVLLPTSYFHNLRPKLEAFLELASTIRERDFDLRHCRRHFKFSCSPGFAPSMMAYVLPRVLSEAPECTVEHVSIGESPISVLMSGDIDLLIGRAVGLPQQAHYADLKTGHRCLLVRKDHPLVYKDKITVDDLTQYKRVSLSSGRKQDWRSPDDEIFSGRNKNESVFFKTDRADMAWKAISESDLILISTEECAKTACALYQNLTIVDLVPHLKLNSPKMAIIWSDSKHRDPAHQWFRNLFLQWRQD
ncbi:LysR substrate-binding domain-containing protein [Parasutterella excrementihominis]|uniref:LysR substrate-binding domain-containing protein n=1 Tax=Parasutterella excrementihominis TaxID=487175 RepID=UPI0035226120